MPSYRMKAVSHLTGIRPELIRMWERRYRLFKPQRADNRYREFDDDDVQLLIYLRQQISQGRAIGELAAEGRDALLRRILPPPAAPQVESPPEAVSLIDELLGYSLQLNKTRFESRLAEIAAFSPFTTLLTTLVTPLMHRLGEAWTQGHATIASGHFAASILKQRLLTLLQTTAPPEDAPVALCACPAGEWHELGLLTMAYAMQQEGWSVYYLGPNLPTQALFDGCQLVQPALVALSMTIASNPAASLNTLDEIDTQVATVYPTIIGGQVIETHYPDVRPRHLTLCSTLEAALQQGSRLQRAATTL